MLLDVDRSCVLCVVCLCFGSFCPLCLERLPPTAIHPTFVDLARCPRKMSSTQTRETPPLLNSHGPLLSWIAFIRLFFCTMDDYAFFLPNFYPIQHLPYGCFGVLGIQWWTVAGFILVSYSELHAHGPNLVLCIQSIHLSGSYLEYIQPVFGEWVSEWIYMIEIRPWEQ